MIAMLIPPIALAVVFLWFFVSQGRTVFKAWREGVIAGDSLVKGMVQRAVDPAEFNRLLADKIRRMASVVVLAMVMGFLMWPVLRSATSH
ncbi:hypothetical protein [Caulobacter sp. LARHSG274]